MALVLGAVGSLFPASATTSCSLEAFTSRGDVQASAPVTISGPPRHTVLARAHNMSVVTVAPSRTVVVSRKKRKRGRRPDAGDGGNDDDGPGDGGSWGGGGWGDEGEDGEGRPRWANQNLWMWQLLCICSLLQAVHHMATKHEEPPQKRIFTFASTAATTTPPMQHV